MPIICRDSFPPGEAKNRNQNPPPFNAQLNFPTLRADSIRPYRAYALNRVLAEIRGYGRIISAPTAGVCAHPGACEYPGLRADNIRPYSGVCKTVSEW